MPEPTILPEIKVTLTRCQSGQRAVPLDYPDNLGTRTKLGGQPDWIQGDQTPHCSSCGEPMTFVAQIDSVEHWSDKNPLSKNAIKEKQDYMFGDVGMIYVFFCFECLSTQSVFDCY
jgi:uncharacterized protein YwqG